MDIIVPKLTTTIDKTKLSDRKLAFVFVEITERLKHDHGVSYGCLLTATGKIFLTLCENLLLNSWFSLNKYNFFLYNMESSMIFLRKKNPYSIMIRYINFIFLRVTLERKTNGKFEELEERTKTLHTDISF